MRTGLGLQQPSGNWTNGFYYDLAGQLTNVTSQAGSFTYLLGGTASAGTLIKKLTLPNTAYITNTFDSVSRITGTYLKNSGNSVLDSYVYQSDPANERTNLDRADASTVAYSYDKIGQVKVANSSVNSEDRGYLYDAAWNLNWLTNNGSASQFIVDSKNELTNAPVSSGISYVLRKTQTVAYWTAQYMPNRELDPRLSKEVNGVRLYLERETRWTRKFVSADGKLELRNSKFQDGTVKITLGELQLEWPSWTTDQKKDFCDAMICPPEGERVAILEFIVNHADFGLLSNNALTITRYLERPAAFAWLIECIDKSALGAGVNFVQALVTLREPRATEFIRKRLVILWQHPRVLEDEPFMNWIAAEAIECVKSLIDLGCAKSEYAEKIDVLTRHPCERVRTLCRSRISSDLH